MKRFGVWDSRFPWLASRKSNMASWKIPKLAGKITKKCSRLMTPEELHSGVELGDASRLHVAIHRNCFFRNMWNEESWSHGDSNMVMTCSWPMFFCWFYVFSHIMSYVSSILFNQFQSLWWWPPIFHALGGSTTPPGCFPDLQNPKTSVSKGNSLLVKLCGDL